MPTTSSVANNTYCADCQLEYYADCNWRQHLTKRPYLVGAVKGLVVHIELVKGWRVCVHSLDGECGELVVGNNSGVDAVLVTHLRL